MPTDTRDEGRRTWYRSWPEEFTERRKFKPEAENKPYIEFLQGHYKSENEGAYGGSGEEDEEGEEEEEEDQDGGGENINQNGIGADPDKSKNGYDAIEGYSNVRLFMKGSDDYDRMLQYPDQVEQVVVFCDRNVSDLSKRTVLLDDRNNPGCLSKTPGERRPYLGALTAQEARAELSKKVTHLQSTDDNSS
jgi:hypothetical protein